jgi:hypothetical protein
MKFISRAAGVAAATLVAGTLAAVAPATAATGSLDYTCTAYGLPVAVKVTFDTDAPASLVSGTKSAVLNGTATVTVPSGGEPDWAQTLRNLGDSVEGTATTDLTLDGAVKQSALTIAKQDIKGTGDVTIKAAGPLFEVTAGAGGATHVIKASKFKTDLTFAKDDGSAPATPAATLDCAPTEGVTQDLTVDTVAVTAAPAPAPAPAPAKADTTTTTKAKFIKKKNMIKAVVKVAGGDTAATGKARVVVKKGKKVVKKLKVTVKNGKAVAKVKKITNKGKYKVNVTYLGDATHNKSKAKKVVVKVA